MVETVEIYFFYKFRNSRMQRKPQHPQKKKWYQKSSLRVQQGVSIWSTKLNVGCLLKSLKIFHFFVAKVNTGIKYKIRSSPNKIQNPTQKIKKRNKEAPIEEKTYSEQVKPRPRLPSNAEQIKPRPRLPSNAEQIKTRPRLLSIIQDWKSRTSNSTACHKSGPEECREEGLLDDDIYEGLDVDPTLLLHGLESDWIEEEMSDDDDFKYNLTCNIRLCHIVVSPRKDVLEVKMLKHLESIGYQPTFQVKVR